MAKVLSATIIVFLVFTLLLTFIGNEVNITRAETVRLSNVEDRRVNQYQVASDRSSDFNCQRDSVYSLNKDTCSCILQNSNYRITFPNTRNRD